MSKNKFLLLLALALGLCLRLIWLDKYPAGFTVDEAAFGYNAYSLLLTGRDEWGVPFWRLPVTNLKSFGEYKLPLYSFLIVPSIKLFGLTETAVRLPNAILGSLSIVSVYLLARRLFSRSTADVAALLTAISPWSVMLSRGAFEANLIIFFLPLALYLWLTRHPALSLIFLGLNFYSYHSARFLTVLTIPILISFYRPKFIIHKSLLVLLLFIPGLWSFFGPGNSRVTDVSIFNPTDNWKNVADRRFDARAYGLPDPVARLFSNKLTSTISLFVKNYFTYFSPQFLFTTGPAEASHGLIPGRGVLYYIELPLLLAFLVSFIRRPRRSHWLIILFLLAAPIPAALSKGTGFAGNRSAGMIPFLILASASGMIYLISTLPRLRRLIVISLAAGYLALFGFLAEDYLYHAPRISAPAMNYGWRQLFTRLTPIAARFSEVRINRSLSEPHIFLAFYLRYPPAKYQKFSASWPDIGREGLTFLDQYNGYWLDKYRFGDTHHEDRVTQPVLYVIPPGHFPQNYPEYFHIDYPTGKPAIIIVEKKP